jgi:hypothetical protein
MSESEFARQERYYLFTFAALRPRLVVGGTVGMTFRLL